MRLAGPEIPEKPFPYSFLFEDGTGHPSWCRPKMGFSARNGRTGVIPQALASTQINGQWTRLDNFFTKNWSKTSKSISLGQNSILGPQTL